MTTNYVSIDILNYTGEESALTNDGIYISVIGNGDNFVVEKDGKCSAGSPNNATKLTTLTGPLQFDATIGITGGRIYFSTSSTIITPSTEPDITTSTQYFDWVEFTLVANKQIVINTTQVDQFGFPIVLEVDPPDANVGPLAGISLDRESLISDFRQFIPPSSGYDNCLDKNGDDYLRILSPNQAMVKHFDSKLSDGFVQAIDDFFTHYRTNDLYLNSLYSAPYVGGVLHTVSRTGTDGNTHNYIALQFNLAPSADAPRNSGIPTPPSGPFNIYYPFFSTNNPAGHTSLYGATPPPPPKWWDDEIKNGYLNKEENPSQMVFGSNGVFADDLWQYDIDTPNTNAKALGNLENQVNAAFNRGYAKSWFTLVGNIAAGSDSPPYTSTVTLSSKTYTDQNTPNTTANLAIGMQVISYAAGIPLTITAIGSDKTSFTVQSPDPILPQNDLYLTFASFFDQGVAQNAYVKFFHQPQVSIGGRAYAFSFDDQGGFSSTLTSCWKTSPSKVNVILGPWKPTFTIQAKQPWQATGTMVSVSAKTTIAYTSGLWTANPKVSNGELYDANGNPAYVATQPGYPMTGANEGALVGRIGEKGTPFLIGNGPVTAPAGENGMLYLCINDDLKGLYGAGLTDNIGSITVKITH